MTVCGFTNIKRLSNQTWCRTHHQAKDVCARVYVRAFVCCGMSFHYLIRNRSLKRLTDTVLASTLPRSKQCLLAFLFG